MRIVIDTNILVSSFFGGNPRKIIDLWKNGRITLCLSGDIIDEYVEVLQRFGVSKVELRGLLDLFAKRIYSVFTTKTNKLNIVNDDPDDNKFFECAVALEAEYIISGDNKVLSIKKYVNIEVISVKDFLEMDNI